LRRISVVGACHRGQILSQAQKDGAIGNGRRGEVPIKRVQAIRDINRVLHRAVPPGFEFRRN
jgi:hypothetical protein